MVLKFCLFGFCVVLFEPQHRDTPTPTATPVEVQDVDIVNVGVKLLDLDASEQAVARSNVPLATPEPVLQSESGTNWYHQYIVEIALAATFVLAILICLAVGLALRRRRKHQAYHTIKSSNDNNRPPDRLSYVEGMTYSV